MDIVIFEDSVSSRLFPLAELRPTFEIKAGAFSIREKTEKLIEGNTIFYHVRDYMIRYATELYGEEKIFTSCRNDVLFLNGKVIFDKETMDILLREKNFILNDDGEIIAFSTSDSALAEDIINNRAISNKLNVLKIDKKYKVINYSWDAVRFFDEELKNDLETMFSKNEPENNDSDFDPNKIRIHTKANIYPDVVLDGTKGKIFIDENAVIEPFTFIKGPVYIGKNTLVKSGTKIYGAASIGLASRVAGEISGTNFHSYVNKQHSGFIGNSYVCEFANLGADTVTSNLKNNYSEIKTTLPGSGELYKTGMQFLGSIIGDHSKIGINTMLNTGSIIGIFSNIAGGDFPAKLVESFQWYIMGKDVSRYKIDEALITAKTVMSRRDVKMSNAYESLIREIYSKL